MSTDPFSDIAFQQEIGQPTYAELIYTQVREGKTFPPSTATVENSLARLAYGKAGPYRDVQPQTPPKLTAIPPNPTRRRYNLSGTTSPQTAQALKAQRIQTDFRRLLTNPSPAAAQQMIRKQSGDPVLNPPFDSIYDVVDLGVPAGLPTNYGGLVFAAGNPNMILVGGAANTLSGKLYAVPVTRGSDGHITSVGAATPSINAPFIDGGVAYHPSGVLFVCGYSTNILHQYKPLSLAPNRTTNLGDSPFNVTSSVGSVGFVPVGYPGAGKCYVISWPSGSVFELRLSAQGSDGLFNVQVALGATTIPGGPEGFVYVPQGSELFPNPSMMVTEYSLGQVSAYELDSEGAPNVLSRRIFLTGLANAEGAAIDPLTGDYVFSTFGGSNKFFLIRGGFVPPDPGTPPACNRVTNSTFDANITNWTTTGGASWHNSGRLRLNGESSAVQVISGLTPNVGWEMEFKVLFNGNITGLNAGTVKVGQIDEGVPTTTEFLQGSSGQLKSYRITGFVPSSGVLRIKFINSGSQPAIDIDDVFLCLSTETGSTDQNPACNRLINGFFDTGIEGWTPSGAIGAIFTPHSWDAGTGRMNTYSGSIYQTITGLTPGRTLDVRFKAYWKDIDPIADAPETATWEVKAELRADSFDGPLIASKSVSQAQNTTADIVFDPDPVVPFSGIVVLTITNFRPTFNGTPYEGLIQLDNITVCEEANAPPSDSCSNPITDVRTFIEWDGVPRQPVNIFNLLARLTYRNPNDPLDKTVVDMLTTTDGRVGTVTPTSCSTGNTCDFWKQQGIAGAPQTVVTNTGLNLATTSAITAGQFASVSTRSNWLWSIPGSTAGTAQDALVSLFPDGEPGILESVEFLMLAHTVNQSGSVQTEALQYSTSANVTGRPQLSDQTMTAEEIAANSGGFNTPPSGYPIGPYFRTIVGSGQILGTQIEREIFGEPEWQNYRYIGSRDFIFAVTQAPPYSIITYEFRTRSQVENPNYLRCLVHLVIDGQIVATVDSGVRSESSNITGPAFGSAGSSVVAGQFNDLTVINATSGITLRVEAYEHQSSPSSAAGPVLDLYPFSATLLGTSSLVGSPVCPGPFVCAPDPAQNFDLIFRYTSSRGQPKEFRKTFSRTTLYQVDATFNPAPNTWDTQVATGKGIKGSTARWESAKFVLDAVDGSGLDQCTTPLEFAATGRGSFNFKKLTLDGRGQATAACDAEVRIEEINKGVAINEIQSIILPGPNGGTWTLRFDYAGQTGTTAPIPYNATAALVRNRLEDIAIIGEGNVRVTGSGTPDVPYTVEFIGLMSARDFRPLKADGADLQGASSAFCTKISVGTLNERQTITKAAGINADLLVTFNGIQSIPIQFNASLDEMQAALEGISTISAGNVSVKGNTSDRTADYQGPWYVDFVGSLAGQNVFPITVQTTGYSAVTNWQGGTGVNDIQKITISASGGNFTLTLTNPDDTSVTATTEAIGLNAGANQVKSKILAACAWLDANDLVVTKLPDTAAAPNLHEWTVEFTDEFAARSIPLMSVTGTNLEGASIIVRETVKGSGSSERQKVSLYKAQGGSYRLNATINNTLATTVIIPWDADAEGIEFALQALPIFPLADDVSVKDTEVRGEGIVASFIVTFSRRFGDVPLMTAVNNLQCNPLNLAAVGPPPYDYVLPECNDDEQISCSPGPLLCRPGEGDPEVAEEPCCDQLSVRDSANVYREVMLQRDLFDPNSYTSSGKALTVRDMAVLKGLRPSLYNAYLRDFHAGTLRPIEMTATVDTKMSVLLIGADIDTKATRDRIARELKRRPNILPSRMSWSNPALQG